MKLIKSLNLLLVLFILLCLSCSNDQHNIDLKIHSDEDIHLRNSELLYGLKLPNETQFTVEGSTILFTLPQGYFLIGNDLNYESRISGAGKLTCTCETAGSSGKCTPTETDKTVGCNTEKSNPCPECKGKVSTSEGHELKEYYIKTPEDTSTKYSLFSEIRAALDMAEWNAANWLDISQLDQTVLENIIEYAWTDYEEGDLTVEVLMLSSAGKFTLEIPYAAMEAGNIYSSEGKTTCSGCEGKCVLEKAAWGKVRYCDGCTSGCTISW